MQFIKGPDFPTGGIVYHATENGNEEDSLQAAYAVGRGKVTVRAKAHLEQMDRGRSRIIVSEILPNALPPVIVLSSLVVAGAVLFESAVSFLGLGDPNLASWGRLVGDGRLLIRSSWYICAIPGVAIMVTVLCLNLIGDGLNDALNPKLRDR